MGNNKPILTPEVIELVKSIAQSTIMDHKHSWIEFTTELDIYTKPETPEKVLKYKAGDHVCIKRDAKHVVYEIICPDPLRLRIINVATGEGIGVMSVNELILAEEKDWIVDDKGIKWSAWRNINGFIYVTANNVRITTSCGATFEEHNMVMERLCNTMNIPIQE